jgi:isopentenyldiphosphate isomerase
MEEHVIIVDAQDQEIGVKPRSELTPEDTVRVTALWLTTLGPGGGRYRI